MTPRRRTLEQRVSSWTGSQVRLDPARLAAELAGDVSIRGGRLVGTGNPTLREIEVLIAIVDHAGNDQAAAALGITVQTVKNHLSSVMQRLGASTRTHAVVLMWPVLKDAWPEPPKVWRAGGPDRRAGYERRRSGRST